MHCNCLIPLTGILGQINVIATLPTYKHGSLAVILLTLMS